MLDLPKNFWIDTSKLDEVNVSCHSILEGSPSHTQLFDLTDVHTLCDGDDTEISAVFSLLKLFAKRLDERIKQMERTLD